jgi:hypothetical protein
MLAEASVAACTRAGRSRCLAGRHFGIGGAQLPRDPPKRLARSSNNRPLQASSARAPAPSRPPIWGGPEGAGTPRSGGGASSRCPDCKQPGPPLAGHRSTERLATAAASFDGAPEREAVWQRRTSVAAPPLRAKRSCAGADPPELRGSACAGLSLPSQRCDHTRDVRLTDWDPPEVAPLIARTGSGSKAVTWRCRTRRRRRSGGRRSRRRNRAQGPLVVAPKCRHLGGAFRPRRSRGCPRAPWRCSPKRALPHARGPGMPLRSAVRRFGKGGAQVPRDSAEASRTLIEQPSSQSRRRHGRGLRQTAQVWGGPEGAGTPRSGGGASSSCPTCKQAGPPLAGHRVTKRPADREPSLDGPRVRGGRQRRSSAAVRPAEAGGSPRPRRRGT